LQLFVGRGRCHLCHAGPLFSNGEFADIGAGFFVRPGVVDSGRHGGIQVLLASPHNLLSPAADTAGEAATKTRHVHLQHRNFGEFKVPSLRNVVQTAPYLHDGRVATLAGMVRHYSELNLERLHADGERILEPLHLTPAETRDLLAFLRSLDDPAARRWQPARLPPCP
jgi:cytochrome c peroxidase